MFYIDGNLSAADMGGFHPPKILLELIITECSEKNSSDFCCRYDTLIGWEPLPLATGFVFDEGSLMSAV